NATLEDRIFYLAALTGMLLTNLCMSASSGGLVQERESGTFEQLLSLPTTALELVLGKLVPYVVICYFVLGVTTLPSGLVCGLCPPRPLLPLWLAPFPSTLASLGIGPLVPTLAPTPTQSVFIPVFSPLPSMLLSGLMLPSSFMPHPIREIGALLPLR